MRHTSGIALLSLCLVISTDAVLAQNAGGPGSGVSDFAIAAPERLSEYIQVDTTNPPGNESRAVAFLAKIFESAGIEYETAESAPGRGNIWARLKGGRKPGLVLLHHSDVVPADARYWDVDPYAGVIKDGYVYGRGALDMKGLGITQLQAFLALHASGRKLNRDVLFVATADEEAGGLFGAGWLVKHKPEIFKGMGFLLNEGGSGQILGDDKVFLVEVTQKVPLWLRLTAHGRPGHGSSPQVETAVTRLFRAGERLAESHFEPRVIDAVETMFAGLADYQQPAFQAPYRDIRKASQDEEFMLGLQLENPGAHALLRNTCSLTRVEGSSKINVVPAEASLELDCRLLPDQNPQAFIQQLVTIVNDSNIDFETLMNFTPAVSSQKTELFRAIVSMAEDRVPGARVIPSVTTGFTDSHFFRDMGIVSYGFAPFMLTPEAHRGVHGNNERVSVRNMIDATERMIDLVERFSLKP